MQTVSRCCLAILVLISTLEIDNCAPIDSRLYRLSKRRLLERELDYLKEKPLSEDLQDFIRRIKRSKERSHPKVKREDYDNVILSDDDDMCRNVTTEPPLASCPPPTTLETTTALTTTSTTTTTTTTTPSTTTATTTTTTSTTTPSTTTIEDEREKEGARLEPQLLTKVVDDVQELLKMQQEDTAKGPESSMCNVTGDWDSNAGGMQIRISEVNATYEKPNVVLVNIEPPPRTAGFLNSDWKMKAHVPFSHCSVVLLTAYHSNSKKIAVFVGECRICENQEAITGSWMIGRKSRSCKDREESHQFFSDVLRRNNVRALQAEHYRLGTAASNTTSAM